MTGAALVSFRRRMRRIERDARRHELPAIASIMRYARLDVCAGAREPAEAEAHYRQWAATQEGIREESERARVLRATLARLLRAVADAARLLCDAA